MSFSAVSTIPPLILVILLGLYATQVSYHESNPLILVASFGDKNNRHQQQQLRQLGIALDPKSVEMKEGSNTVVSVSDTVVAIEDQFCTARVNDGTILTESVIDNNGDFDIALPLGYEAIATIECTKYKRLEPLPSERSETVETYVEMPSRHVVHVPASPEKCNRSNLKKNFHSGYYNLQTHHWYDNCSTGKISPPERTSEEPLSKENCPLLHNRETNEDIWVHFVGDSVMGDWFDFGVLGNAKSEKHGFWKTGTWPGRADTRLIPFAKKEDSDARIWATFRYDAIAQRGKETKYYDRWAHTWGDFVRVRGEKGHTAMDANFSDDKVPDFIFWGPGYHASTFDSTAFGFLVDNMITQLEENAQRINPPVMPRINLLLNIMPAAWMIPSHYARDYEYRTLLNTHRQNLAMIEAAAKHSSTTGIVDLFSLELPYNGKEGEETVHSDAVHFHGKNSQIVYNAGGQRIIDTICYSIESDLISEEIDLA